MMDKNDELLLHYSRALDEVYALRMIVAYEALRIKADLSYKTFPKTRRHFAEAAEKRLKSAARGEAREVARHIERPHEVLRMVDAPVTLTRQSWEASDG